MEYGMPTLIEHNSLEESAALCKELGLSFVELNMNLPQYQVEQLEQIERLKRIAKEYGIYYTIHLDENLNVCDFNRAVANAYRETVRRTIEVARQLQAPILNMHMNPGIHFTLPDRRVRLFEQYNEQYMEDIRSFVAECEGLLAGENIRIAIENTEGYQDYERRAIEEMIMSDTFVLTWDIGHSYAGKESDESFLMKHKKKLAHFHIHDGVGKKNHLTLGSGEIPLEKRLQLARECGGRAVIETKSIAALKQSVTWLEQSWTGDFSKNNV